MSAKRLTQAFGGFLLLVMLIMWVAAIWGSDPRWAYTSMVLVFGALGVFFIADYYLKDEDN